MSAACQNCRSAVEGAGVSRGRFCSEHCYQAHWARSRRKNPGAAERQRESARAWRHRNRSSIRARENAWRKKNRYKIRAERAVQRALAAGEVVQEPCLFCGTEDSEAHHHDYGRPLVVTWLCKKHHAIVHRRAVPV